ncbi:MAG: DnaD domain protein [Oscillospiraceae bacterium]|nr:DnaD domain protein [Oscillospiraceae bacterium]
MEYFLNAGIIGGIFAVPNTVVDNYIKLASESAIKVLLYVLRNANETLSSSGIANALNISENQVEEAFVFWENANVFPKTTPSPAPAKTEKPVVTETTPKAEPQKKTVRQERADYNINPSEIAERVENSEDVKCLFVMSEQAFARPLTHTEQRGLIWIHDYLGLSTEVILMLATFCISADKSNIKYIETVAADWAEREINTLDLAQSEIKRLEEKQSFNNKIMKIFGMDRKPTSKQQGFIDDWKQKGYSLELIEYACEKTIENIDKVNFPYINKILENWYSQGLLTRSQIDSYKKPDSDEQKDYSFDLERYKALVNNFGD